MRSSDAFLPFLVLVPAAAIAAQQAVPDRKAEVPTLLIEVVDAASRQPLPNAEVIWAVKSRREAELARRWGGLESGFDPIEVDEVARAVGTTLVADASGRVTIARPVEPFRIVAATEDRYATRLLEMADFASSDAIVVECAPREVLDVYVVDAQGKPVASVPVATGWYPRFPDSRPRTNDDFVETMDSAWPAGFDGVVDTRAPDGRARFPHAEGWLSPEEARSRTVVLGIPVVPRIELRFDGAHAHERHELVLPPTGRVVLEFPGVEKGVVQLRNAAKGRFGDGVFWRSFEPTRAAIVAGRATFPWVGVGTKLEYRATWRGLAKPVEGTLDGPAREGDEIRYDAGGRAAQPVVAGRLVDEDGRPLASRELNFQTCISWEDASGSGGGGVGAVVRTDSDGRFEFNLAPSYRGYRRLVEISEPWWKHESTLDFASAALDFSAPVAAGVHDLGEVVLRRPGSRRHLRTLSDADLEKVYERARDGVGWSEDARHDADTCLTEMVERGGAHWIDYLERQVEPRKEGEGEPREDSMPLETNITLLTALRRAQRKHDPCALEVPAGTVLVTTFPEVPKIEFRLKNVDEPGVDLHLLSYELSQQSGYCRASVRDGSGREIPLHAPPSWCGGGMGSEMTIKPGDSVPSALSLGDTVFLPHVGDYHVRLHQRHGFEGSNFSRSKGSLDGWIVSSSPEFIVRVLPRSVRLAAGERARLRAKFDAIDVAQPCPLSLNHWDEKKTFAATAAAPAEELYRAGWTAVPPLLDLLDDGSTSPRARAWAVALLFDITGLASPESGENEAWSGLVTSLGRYTWKPQWPMAFELGDADEDQRVLGPESPDPDGLDSLSAKWKELRQSLAISE